MGILSNAISGLQASQNALQTTGHNIANANTAGFSRQEVEYVTRPGQVSGVGFFGSGVITQSIERVASEFLTAQLRADTNNFNELNKFNEQIGSIDSLLADSGTGLSEALQNFFSAIQAGVDDPASTPARQLLLSEADSLTARFNLLYGRLDALNTSTQNESRILFSEVNALAGAIGDLNVSIQQQSAISQGDSPNDLLDQRDEQLRRLSELVSIQVINQDDATVNVTIGSGQPLVIGREVSQFTVETDGSILLANSISNFEVTDFLNGGQIGGLLRFRNDTLTSTFNELGRVALVLADEYNRVQAQGLDLDGDFGGLFFTDINDPNLTGERVIADRGNVGPNDRDIRVRIADTTALTTSDYRLDLVANTQNFIVTRLGDNQEVARGILSGAVPESIRFEGLEVVLNGGSFQGGDSFTIQPTRRGALAIESVIDRAEDVAFASSIRTRTGEGNIGSGLIDPGTVLRTTDSNGNLLSTFATPGQLSPPIAIVFTSPRTYDVLDASNPGNLQHLSPPLRNQPFVPGIDNPIFPTDPGATLVAGDGASLGLPDGRLATTVAVGAPALPNGYPVERFNVITTDPDTGGTSTQVFSTSFNATAQQTAQQLSNLVGVSANAFTELTLTDVNINNVSSPLQITINGEELIGYELGNPAPNVPDPAVNEAAFNSYLASRINNNANLQAQGLFAVSSSNPITGEPELKIVAATGRNVDVRLEGVAGDTLSVNDGVNPNVRLTAVGAGSQSVVTVGGRIDILLDDNVVFDPVLSVSQFFGDTNSPNFSRPAFFGYQAVVKGQPAVGDRFSIEFNSNAESDNRNGLSFVDLEQRSVADDNTLSIAGAYRQLVERIGTTSNLSEINTEAAETLLQETQAARDALSGVNLDEEAADLIRFEQLFNANARVINVARDLFDTLLNAI